MTIFRKKSLLRLVPSGRKKKIIAKACEWLRSRLDINVDVKTDSDGHPLADSYINYAQKRLEAADNFVADFKEAMIKEE